ncbi:uncharacterized protein [Apostichopus japonicus]|uniref:uncharacterized protein isoform X3 n=1 Tax=Stichopus japonicus TaxID=307972 RepID=UPI003AB21200
MKRKMFFQLFFLEVIVIGTVQAGRLCDFASKFPCKGDHCLPCLGDKIKTTEDTTEISTRLTSEKQGTQTIKATEETTELSTGSTTELQSTQPSTFVPTCPTNMIYGTCSCQATCEDPNGQSGCNSDCLGSEGCACPAGFLMQGSDCISASECGCFVAEANLVIPNGETYVNDDCTQKCSCNNNQLICEDDYSCSTDAVCDLKNGVRQCYCNEGYEGDGETCVCLYTDCKDVYDAGHTEDGVYTVLPSRWPGPAFSVYCKMDNGGGWTVFQRRSGGSTSFYRNWAAYKNGFGDINVDFWLGNEKLYYLTNQKYYSLRFDVTTSNRYSKYALYSEFRIMSESHNYRLDRLGSHSGTTGTRFLNNNKGKDFSTYDEDNDGCDKYNCAYRHRGGWWHSGNWCNYCNSGSNHCDQFHYTGESSCYTVCTSENLNGYYNGAHGQNIFSNHDSYCDITFTEMKIRPT